MILKCRIIQTTDFIFELLSKFHNKLFIMKRPSDDSDGFLSFQKSVSAINLVQMVQTKSLTFMPQVAILCFMKTLKYFISYYRPYRSMFFMDLFCASIISLVDIAYPLIFNFCVSGLLVTLQPDTMQKCC